MNKKVEYEEAVRSYYFTGEPIMSDQEFDELEENMRHEGVDVDSIKKMASMQAEYTRAVPMASLTKVRDRDYISQFVENYLSIIEPKVDGLAAEIIYEANEIVGAYTRSGTNITDIVKEMPSVPNRLSDPTVVSVRGEIVIPKSRKLPENYANRRNAASGIVNTKHGTDNIHLLDFVAFTAVIDDHSIPVSDKHYLEDFQNVVPFVQAHKDTDYEAYKTFFEDAGFDYETDGIVIKASEYHHREALGFNGNYKWEFAYKFEDMQYDTVLRKISWQVSGNGKVTPVALFDPVSIDGASISRASVASYAKLRELGLKIGDTIRIKRANMVIPYIVFSHQDGDTEIDIPELEVDGKLVTPVQDGAHLFVERRMYDNPEHAIRHGIGVLGAKNITKSKINKAIEAGAETIFDFYFYIERINDTKTLDKIKHLVEIDETGKWLSFLGLESYGGKTLSNISSEYKTFNDFANDVRERNLQSLTPRLAGIAYKNEDIIYDINNDIYEMKRKCNVA